MPLLTGRDARASRVYAARVRERARAFYERVRASGVARTATKHGATESNGEASKSETKGAHTAILDSIVIKRGATAARAGRCIAVAVAVVAVAALVLRRRTRDGTLRHSSTILAIPAARYDDIGTLRPLVAARS